jgi:FdhD protein
MLENDMLENDMLDAHSVPTLAQVEVRRARDADWQQALDHVAEETPVALEYNGISHAVMLATPADLEDFALGFSLSEGILGNAAELYDCEVIPDPSGLRVAMQIPQQRFMRLKEMRRSLAGRTGCGLCGTESLQHAVRLPATVTAQARHAAATLYAGLASMQTGQALQHKTGATHAAAWVSGSGELALLREDVGRHNALDKLVGALARAGIDASAGAILVTSRASVEMVQKAAACGAGVLAAVSAPTALAVRSAEQCGLTLLGFVREGRHVAYTHTHRIL